MDTGKVKDRLRLEGRSIKEWAADRGVTDYAAVCQLMSGARKGVRGKGHRIAVALGLKKSNDTGEIK
jgi:gp16 family phage-associated protein